MATLFRVDFQRRYHFGVVVLLTVHFSFQRATASGFAAENKNEDMKYVVELCVARLNS